MAISKMLTISTAHILPETAEWLGYTDTLSVYEKEEYGWFINFFDGSDDSLIPNDLSAVIAYTRKQGCEMLCLDRDGDCVDDLPTYSWESEII